MPEIAIITDTDSSLPVDIAAQYGIQQVPITIHFDQESFTTGVDIDDRILFEKIDHYNKLPTTAAPSPSAFTNAYEKAFNGGAEAIICICVSSKISATYNSALTACEMFPNRQISVIDSLFVSMGQGFLAIAAAEAAQKGASFKEVVNLVEEMRHHLHEYAVLSTLKYLAMSGRVGSLVAGMADTFNIKPILSVQDGKLDLLERVRTHKKAMQRMLDLTHSAISDHTIQRIAVVHTNNPAGALDFKTQLQASITYQGDIITAEFTPGLSVHTGSGVVGVIIVTGS
jgi:DegV family protein with EDD domain